MYNRRIDLSPRAQSSLKFARWIRVGFLVLIIVYGAIAQMLTLDPVQAAPSDSETHMTFSILGIGMCFVASLFNQLGLKRIRTSGANSSAMVHKLLPLFIITWALAESCAVFGLVFTIMTQDSAQYSLFGLLAFLTILAHPLSTGRVRSLLNT